jgi:hypothetical protein
MRIEQPVHCMSSKKGSEENDKQIDVAKQRNQAYKNNPHNYLENNSK